MTENKKYPIDHRNGRINCPNLEHRIGSILANMCYKAGRDFKIDLYESDVQWMEKNISKNSQNNNRDILWRFENLGRSPYLLDYMATYFEKFVDMPDIPRNVNRILIYAVGYLRFWHYLKNPTIAQYQHFFIARWLETCH